ncbi:hypothetical protein GCM10022380_88490 [Amycolatopsis tucumanensis]|uniref:Uncharacterized protein n=2 Tax=Amycolatopsis tucumanensis TaxID=401106 RepID=A0ABP7JYR5_9PSEU
MSRRIARFVIIGAVLAVPVLSAPAWAAAAPEANQFGQHVRQCAQQHGFTGDHNPGMHHGAAGWDGMSCPV